MNNYTGYLHHWVHVFGIPETVSEEDQKECEEITVAGMETMVYADPLSTQVSLF